MERYKEYKKTIIPWLKEIPSHWEEIKVKFIANISKGNGITKLDVFEDGDTPCVRYGEIYTKYNNSFSSCYSSTFKDLIQSPRYFEFGNILVSGTGELVEEIGKSVVYMGKDICLAGGDIIILKHYQNPIFLNYALNTKYTQEQKSFGKAKLKVVHISSSEIGGLLITLPPLSEQEKIVSYIESKTSKIDEYIAEKEKEVQLLNELKEAEIAKVVTQGLNPNVKMKDYDSLISPSCPEHWSIVRNKSFLSLTGEKVGSRANEFLLLSLTTKGVIVRDMESGKGKFPKDFDTYQFVKKDELVFCLFDIDETPRTVGIVEIEGMLTGAYTALKVNPKLALPEYIYNYYLCVDNIKALKPYYSGLRKTIRADKFLQIYMPLPPLDEQRAIVAYINEKTAKVESLITDLQAEIEHLKEYKQRLIADVVTGQVNVQNETI